MSHVFSASNVNVSLCDLWLQEAEMWLYAQLPACNEEVLGTQEAPAALKTCLLHNSGFFITALLIQLFWTETFLDKSSTYLISYLIIKCS